MCASPDFMRSPGTCQRALGKSISPQVAPLALAETRSSQDDEEHHQPYGLSHRKAQPFGQSLTSLGMRKARVVADTRPSLGKKPLQVGSRIVEPVILRDGPIEDSLDVSAAGTVPGALRPRQCGRTMSRTSPSEMVAIGLSPMAGRTYLSKPRHHEASVVFLFQFERRFSVTIS